MDIHIDTTDISNLVKITPIFDNHQFYPDDEISNSLVVNVLD